MVRWVGTWAAVRLAECLWQAGVPHDALQLVHGGSEALPEEKTLVATWCLAPWSSKNLKWSSLGKFLPEAILVFSTMWLKILNTKLLIIQVQNIR